MRISDWSSDVCSSDLFGAVDVARDDRQAVVAELDVAAETEVAVGVDLSQPEPVGQGDFERRLAPLMPCPAGVEGERKSVVTGQSVSVRVDLGGRSLIKKKKHNKRV